MLFKTRSAVWFHGLWERVPKTVGPATQKALSQNFVLVRGTMVVVLAWHRWHRQEFWVVSITASLRYRGHWPMFALNISRASLNWKR